MHYGHSSWIALVVFGGMVAIRYLTSQRRRGDHPQGPHSGSSFTGPGRSGPAAEPFVDARGTPGTKSTGTAPGWFTDPFLKHEQRYWSGTEWTEHVTDDGVPGTDPPPQSFGRRAAG